MKIVGIDYGHGETSAGYVDSETIIGNDIRMQDLKITGEQIVIPSLICKTHTGEYFISPSSNQLAKAETIGICFKAPLVGNQRYKQITEENKVFFREFLSKVYNSIVGNDNNPLHVDNNGNRDFKVYIACPSGWDTEQIKRYKEFACNECSIPLEDIVKESRAAYIAARRKVSGGIRTQGGNVLVIDFGSSTIDFTYFNNSSIFEPIHEGYPYGASQVEKDILSYLIKSNPEAKNNVDTVLHKFGETMGTNAILFSIRKLKEEYFSTENPSFFNPSIHLRELLLDKSLTGLYIEPKEEEGFSKPQLTDIILKDYISSLSNMLDDFRKKEGVSSIDKVILTGGASRMFFFKDLVSKKYGVSKNEQTLIVDLEPSLTISQGIAAFGYMKEKSEPVEARLRAGVEDYVTRKLPNALAEAINTALAKYYYNKLTDITTRYKSGYIVDNRGNHSICALNKALSDFLKSGKANSKALGGQIAPFINSSIEKNIEDTLTDYINTWNSEMEGINIELNFNKEFILSKEIIDNISLKCASVFDNTFSIVEDFVENIFGDLGELLIDVVDFVKDKIEDWFGVVLDPDLKDRGSESRKAIVDNLNPKLKAACDNIHYDGKMTEELTIIGNSIRSKLQDIIEKAELEMYK